MLNTKYLLLLLTLIIFISFSNSILFGQNKTTVLIAYYSLSGNTEEMANAVEEGAKLDSNVSVKKKFISEVTAEDLDTADGIILGSPTYFGNISGPMKNFIDDWAFKYQVYFENKIGGAFATGDGITGGKENVVISLLLAMMINGMIVAGPVYNQDGIRFGYLGASAVSSDGISKDELGDAKKLGERISKLTQMFNRKK